MSLADLYKFYGRFDARIIDAFGPIIRSSHSHPSGRLYDGCVFAYPMDEGALIMAVDGVVAACVHDKRAKLSAPVQLMLPDELIDACAPPAPIRVWYENWAVDRDLPEWAQPSFLTVFGAGAYVSTKMPHPDDEDGEYGVLASVCAESGNCYSSEDYRAKEPRYDPRHVFKSIVGDGGPAAVNPRLIGLFDRARQVLNGRGVTTFQPHAPEAPITVHFSECPDFLGLVMPTRAGPGIKLPAFAMTSATEPA